MGMAACHCPGSRKTASIQIARTMSSARPLMPWVPVCCSESDPCQSSIIRCDSHGAHVRVIQLWLMIVSILCVGAKQTQCKCKQVRGDSLH